MEPTIIDPKETRRQELDSLDRDSLIQAVLKAEAETAFANGELDEEDNYSNKLKKSRNRYRWLWIPLFLILGILLGMFLQGKYHHISWCPNKHSQRLQAALDTCYMERRAEKVKVDSTIRTFKNRLISVMASRDAYVDSLTDCRKGKPPKRTDTGKKGSGKNRGKEVKELLNSGPPYTPKLINQDSVDFYSDQPAKNTDDSSGNSNQTESTEGERQYSVNYSSGENAFVKPTKYGLHGKNKTYSNYGKVLKKYKKQK